MVNIQRPDYGGGEIYFDGKLIRRERRVFLPKQLRSLNWLAESKTTKKACVTWLGLGFGPR